MGRKPSKNLNLPPRMRARTKASGITYYYYDAGGKPRREIPLGPDYALAVKKWAELEIDARPRHIEIITFKYVADRYIRDVLPGKAPRSQRDNIKELAKLLEFFNDPPAPLDGIQPLAIRQYMDWRRDAPVRANREKALFSHIFNKAREWGYTDRPNPCAGVQGFKETGRDTYVEDSVFNAVHAAADGPLQDAMDMAYLTGQRPADTLAIAETDIRDDVLHVRQSKTGKKVRIKIAGELAAVVQRIRARKAGKIHALKLIVNEEGRPLTYSALRSRFDRAREDAIKAHPELATEIRNFQFRDLRAKAGTDKAESSGDIRKAQKQLGHANIAMTEHYLRERKGDMSDPTR